MTLERIFELTGAYDLTFHPKNYGIGGMQMIFTIKGEKGRVVCRMHTSWYLPQNQYVTYNAFSRAPFSPFESLMQPSLVMLDYYTPDGKSDGSALWFEEEWMLGFLHGGSEWLWPRLEQLYDHWLNGGPSPDLTPIPRTIKE